MCVQTIFTIVGSITVLIFSIIIHEFMHGWVANYLGDDTAKLSGRLTLNPIPHIDPIGSILVPVFLILIGSPFLIGWAKPVPINPLRFKNYRMGTALTSLAGPLSNLSLATVLALIVRVGLIADPQIILVLTYGVLINLAIMFFNLIPIPPLDGSKVISFFIPEFTSPRFEAFGPILILALLYLGGFSLIIFPLVSLIFHLFGVSMAPLSCPLI